MGVELLPPPGSENCPSCMAPAGALTLLTSMTRYYSCARCQRSWQVTRGIDTDRGRPTGGVLSVQADLESQASAMPARLRDGARVGRSGRSTPLAIAPCPGEGVQRVLWRAFVLRVNAKWSGRTPQPVAAVAKTPAIDPAQ